MALTMQMRRTVVSKAIYDVSLVCGHNSRGLSRTIIQAHPSWRYLEFGCGTWPTQSDESLSLLIEGCLGEPVSGFYVRGRTNVFLWDRDEAPSPYARLKFGMGASNCLLLVRPRLAHLRGTARVNVMVITSTAFDWLSQQLYMRTIVHPMYIRVYDNGSYLLPLSVRLRSFDCFIDPDIHRLDDGLGGVFEGSNISGDVIFFGARAAFYRGEHPLQECATPLSNSSSSRLLFSVILFAVSIFCVFIYIVGFPLFISRRLVLPRGIV